MRRPGQENFLFHPELQARFRALVKSLPAKTKPSHVAGGALILLLEQDLVKVQELIRRAKAYELEPSEADKAEFESGRQVARKAAAAARKQSQEGKVAKPRRVK